jgi:hypothetical protein
VRASRSITDIAWQNEEVIVCESAVFVGVQELVDRETVPGVVLVQILESLLEGQDFFVGEERDTASHGIAIEDRHCGSKLLKNELSWESVDRR